MLNLSILKSTIFSILERIFSSNFTSIPSLYMFSIFCNIFIIAPTIQFNLLSAVGNIFVQGLFSDRSSFELYIVFSILNIVGFSILRIIYNILEKMLDQNTPSYTYNLFLYFLRYSLKDKSIFSVFISSTKLKILAERP